VGVLVGPASPPVDPTQAAVKEPATASTAAAIPAAHLPGARHRRDHVLGGRQRAGLDRADLFRRAAGSASELTTALRIARARSYITADDHAALDAALDRVRAMHSH
jgi:hypothetical protein